MALWRDILHVDMDAFFASVEQVLDPALRGRPVVVGGRAEDRSVVASASYEARGYGIRSAMPIARARGLCPGAVFVRGNFGAYGEFSERVHEVLLRFTPVIEVMSLDDFYLDLTGCRRLHGPVFDTAERIKDAVREGTGLRVSIGVATNKLVAKVASGLAKPNGILRVYAGGEEAFFRSLPVEELPGVGGSTAEELHKFNLTSLGEVAGVSAAMLEGVFGGLGAVLGERACGRDVSPVMAEAGAPKSVSRERTFARDTADAKEVRGVLYALVERAAWRLRAEGLLAGRVTVKVRYSDFRTATAAGAPAAATDVDEDLYQAGVDRLERLLRRRVCIRLVGVSLSGLIPRGERQGMLFAGEAARRGRRLCRGLDGLRARFGFGIVRVGPALRLRGREVDG